jgi:CubicO group peptidase (beta-lactamase class C family)
MNSDNLDNFWMTLRLRSACVAFRTSVLCGALILSPASISGQADRTKQVFDRENTYITAESVTHSFRGAVLVGIDGKIVFEKGYGLADEEWDAPNTTTTKLRIASLGKQFTAAGILLLQERGRLNVHDSISRYLSDLPETWQPVTIHQLLTHTSGIPNYTSSPQIAKLNRTGATPEEMIALVHDKPLDFKPGTKWSYTNTGYILLGMIIEKASSQSFAEF